MGSYCVGDRLKLVLEEVTKSVTELGHIPWTGGRWVDRQIMSIYIAHRRRKTSNALDTLVLSEQ